jgi:hypothetical protein
MQNCAGALFLRITRLSVLSLVLWSGVSNAASEMCLFPHMRHNWKDGQTDQRPRSDASIDSQKFPIRLHYPKDVEVNYAELALLEVEHSWQRLVEEMGYLPPHPDGDLGGGPSFDVYITRELAAGVGGYAGFSGYNEATPRADAIGYLVIGADLKPHVLQFVVSHEFFHGIQMAYDWWEDIAFMEASANWATELVYPELEVYAKFLPFFQAEPYLALDFVSIKNPYQYGMLMWPMFIEERFGKRDGSLMRQMWEKTVQNEMNNEPDFLDTAMEISSQNGVESLRELFGQFNWWRLFVGRFKEAGRFLERNLWDEKVNVYFEATISADQLPFELSAMQALQPMSSAFVEVEQSPHQSISFDLRFDLPADFELMALSPSGEILAKVWFEDVATGTIDLPPYSESRKLIWMISYVGDRDYDSDTSPWTVNSWSFRVK